MFADRRGIAQYAYLIVIGMLLALFAGTVIILVITRPDAAPAPAPAAPTVSGESETPAADLLIGLSDTPPILTDREIIFTGTLAAEAEGVSVRWQGPNGPTDAGGTLSQYDPDTRRWSAAFNRTEVGTGTVRFLFETRVDGMVQTAWRDVLIPASSVADEGPSTSITVDWRDIPLEMSAYDVATALGLEGQQVNDVVPQGGEFVSEYYKVGTVMSAAYAGADVLVAFMPCIDLCFQQPMMRFIVDAQTHRLVNLAAYGPRAADVLYISPSTVGEMSGSYGQPTGFIQPGNRVADDATLRIAELDLPIRLTLRGADVQLVRPEFERSRFVTRNDVTEVGRTADGRTLYAEAGFNCLLVKRPDHTFAQYDFVLSFFSGEGRFPGDTARIPQLTWSDGVVNAADYMHADIGGCGATSCYAVRPESEVKPSERLLEAGRLSNGDIVYTLKNLRDEELRALYDASVAYVPEGEVRPTFEAFVATRPLFYWKDPLGRWVRWVRLDALPAVECGKPVIYLYPEKQMSVAVRVGLKGQMTVSEPPHGARGWKVTARPDGYVVNAADGKTYPNLYWEGTGVNYKTPTNGFVVKTAEADAWLKTTLAKIGFTERESAEFREFWVPRLPDTPYTFITFVPQGDFDRDAPLSITPEPDRVYRVFMEYRGLQAPISVAPLSLPKIERSGFTVVEWGGALKK
ncbi:hypothetical protein EPO33_01065 [Patescibacteria group bacterium]|nr:MAG: hypothetical protein EPO33_01065 [Patescibacteria group bacterium]